MSAGHLENELSNSNGLSSYNEGEMNNSEKKGDSIEDKEDDSSLFATLEMKPYLFKNVMANEWESALEEDQGAAISKLTDTNWCVYES